MQGLLVNKESMLPQMPFVSLQYILVCMSKICHVLERSICTL